MVRHVIIWTLKDEYTDSEKETIRQGIRKGWKGFRVKSQG